MRVLGVVTLLLVVSVCHGGLLSWLFKKKNPAENTEGGETARQEEEQQTKTHSAGAPSLNEDGRGSDGAVAAIIPFEIKSSDEKFLKAATQLGVIKNSELDVCHHKIILTLEKACSELTEEELSKVAVNLLNCQSGVENRPIYACTADMSLSECTKDMDSNTWNAYHIISNRARAVCYSSRQEQFGAKTQMAVNVLMHTAEEQIKSMNQLQDGQRVLGEATAETMESLSHGHEHLRQQQQQLSAAHQHVHSYISLNLRELSREKKLIASGQRELAQITEAIKRKIEEAKRQLVSQEHNQRASHELILQDLSKIQDNALQIFQKLNASTLNILQAHEETVQQYGQLSADVQRMNTTVHHLMELLHSTRRGVEERLSWISSLVGGTDNTIQKAYSCVLHFFYFFVGMVAASFLQVPYMTRVALVVLVPLNALSEMRHDSSLEFSTLTTVLVLCIIVNHVFSWIWSVFRQRRKTECLQSSSLHHSICCSPPTAASQPSPCMQLRPEHPLEKTHELKDQSSKGPDNSSFCDSVKMAGDFSSDEEPPSTASTPQNVSLFSRRLFSSISKGSEVSASKGREGALEAHQEEEDTGEEAECGGATADRSRGSEAAIKTLSSVRRRLLSHLDSFEPRNFQPNLSFEHRDTTAADWTTRGASLNQSTLSSRSFTPRRLCAAVCKNGQLCRNTVMGEHLYCHRHMAGGSREATPVSRRGSRRSTPLHS